MRRLGGAQPIEDAAEEPQEGGDGRALKSDSRLQLAVVVLDEGLYLSRAMWVKTETYPFPRSAISGRLVVRSDWVKVAPSA